MILIIFMIIVEFNDVNIGKADSIEYDHKKKKLIVKEYLFRGGFEKPVKFEHRNKKRIRR